MDRLAAMETFARVVESGSFSAAARGLGVGQPAVSKTVAQLEERLGVRLLMRTTRGLSPTEAGLRFYERAKRAIEEAEEAELAARGAGASLTGPLRVSAAVTFARLHVVPRLPKFLAQHPGLTMDVVLDDRVIDLVEAGVDVALRMGSLSASSLTVRRLASGQRHVVGTPAYFARAGVPAAPADLTGHAAVIYAQEDAGEAWSFRKGATEVSVSVSGQLRVSAAEGVRAGVLADMGLAIASAWMFSPELASGAVRAVLTDWSLPPIDLWAVYPAGRMPSAKARAFAAFVKAELQQAHSPQE
ncbi:MAG TPA: LysR family transcriptional regulator [Roseomonas sp.]|nr:LysR family transcriptional regulator [Roseomonas sp.]